ncbi:hypothetical protein QTP88_020214 [Uroleucon formosanum]
MCFINYHVLWLKTESLEQRIFDVTPSHRHYPDFFFVHPFRDFNYYCGWNKNLYYFCCQIINQHESCLPEFLNKNNQNMFKMVFRLRYLLSIEICLFLSTKIVICFITTNHCSILNI